MSGFLCMTFFGLRCAGKCSGCMISGKPAICANVIEYCDDDMTHDNKQICKFTVVVFFFYIVLVIFRLFFTYKHLNFITYTVKKQSLPFLMSFSCRFAHSRDTR